MSAATNPRKLDIRRFIEHGETLSGYCALQDLSRLAASVLPGSDSASVFWQARGEARPRPGAAPEWWLHLTAHANAVLECQRCLSGVSEVLDVARTLRFVATEAQAEALDAEVEEDVLALRPRLDLLELVEDELLLALPIVPRHSLCPEPLPQPDAALPGNDAGDGQKGEPGKAHPFALLATLKKPQP